MQQNRTATLGDTVRDRVTGFTGIVVTHATYLTGCDRLWVQPPVDKDGKQVEGMWIDIDMAEVTEPGTLARVTYTRTAPGGVDLPAPR